MTARHMARRKQTKRQSDNRYLQQHATVGPARVCGHQKAATGDRYRQEISAFISAGYQELIEAYLVTTNKTPGSERQLLRDATGELHERYAAEQGGVVLIRPDGDIGFRGQFAATQPLRRYLQALFLPD